MLAAEFSAAMDRLGPFEVSPTLAVAVSGGADSTALAILLRDWATRRGGSVLALIVDHGLRPESAAEAELTAQRLAGLGIPARLLTLTTLNRGPALAERARIARYRILTKACRDAGIPHLLLGHHLSDQIETLAMRVLRGSHTHGLAGMSALTETTALRLLRPLLTIEPSRLRDFLTQHRVDWTEDPSNHDRRTLRARLRQGLTIPRRAETGLPNALHAAGELRAREETSTAAEIAERATIRPEGFAILRPGRISGLALRALIQMLNGAAYPTQINDLASNIRPGTVAGVRILPAGRFADGWLLVREEAAMEAPVPAVDGTLWDRRFRLCAPGRLARGATLGNLGSDASRFRSRSDLPSAVLRSLPAIRVGKVLAQVPHLGYSLIENDVRVTIVFDPARPALAAAFLPAAPVA